MNSSHSGTPIFSPAVAVVAVAGLAAVAALLELPVVELELLAGSVLEHPISTMVQSTHSNNEILINM